MNREQAKELIKDTFESPFDKGKFVVFIKNLLNHIEESPFIYKGNIIPDAFKQYISTLERIGKYTDGKNEIDLLIVKLKRETSLERARAMQRNFIAWYLKGSRGGIYKNAALVAFVSPDEEDWRFSLVKVDYVFDENGKVVEEKSPARRWSFLVGKNEKSHTAQSRLLPILEDDEHNLTLKQLEEAFNIEPVTKEFFKKYRDLLIKTVDALDRIIEKDEKVKRDFESKNINSVDFAKKLLEQIVFLYFLQKKGWFGVAQNEKWGEGDKNFIRNLFKNCEKGGKNFFNDYLEVLFYKSLNNPRTDQADPTWSNDFDCKIPFLNGGLFEPIGNYDWKHTDISLPNNLFSNTHRTHEGDIGDGILDVFGRFNFTVKEDEPLEKEVAIDPELLGKLYEKFNAIRPDNFYEYKKALASGKKSLENRFNKKFGVYYTPREIVHYMCQQSLINYLHTSVNQDLIKQPARTPRQTKLFGPEEPEQLRFRTEKDLVNKQDIEKLIKYGEQFTENEAAALIKEQRIKEGKQKTSDYKLKLPESIRKNAKIIDEKLKNIKICDPAVGSGAFPVGMMHEIVKTRIALNPFIKDKDRTSYNFKRECIENSLYGVDIDSGACEIAKLRLWLSLIIDEENIEKIKPLPNLDYKIMQGNSLISEFMGINFDARSKPDKLFNDEEENLIKQFKDKKNELLKESDRQKKENLRKEIEELIIKIFEAKLKKQKADYFNRLKSIKRSALMLPNKEHQDKYFREEKEKLYKTTGFNLEETEKQLKEYTSGKKTRPFFPWKLYFAEVFTGENPGFDIVIANPPYVGEKGHKEMFREIKQANLSKFYQGKMDLFYFFFHLSLNIAKQDAYITFITTNYYLTATGARKLRQDFRERAIIKKLINFNELKIFEGLGVHNMIAILQKGNKQDAIAETCITERQGDAKPEILNNIFNGTDKKTKYYKIPQKNLYDGEERYIRLAGISEVSDDPIQRILNKMKNQGVNLGTLCNINQGIVTGADKVSRKHISKYNIKANVGDGIFVLSAEEIKKLNFTSFEKSILQPWFKNSHIKRWNTNIKTDEFVLYLDGRYKPNEIPNIIKHLSKFKANLQERREVHKGARNWYDLWRSRKQTIFESPKIVVPQRSPRNTFGYNEIPWYAASDVFFITQKDKSVSLKYILSLINSELYFLWLYYRGKRKGETLELIAKPLSEIPIKKISKEEQKTFIAIVDKILAITKDDDYLENPTKQAKVREYEKQIDQLVYKLYNLTEDEIKIVKGKSDHR